MSMLLVRESHITCNGIYKRFFLLQFFFKEPRECWNVLELVGVTEGEGSGNRGKVPELIGVTEGSGINMHY